MSETDSEDNDVAESEKSTRDSLYPDNPPKRRHKKKKKKKKCKIMRRICIRVPKFIFFTGIGLLVVFSMKRLSELNKDGDGKSTGRPDTTSQPPNPDRRAVDIKLDDDVFDRKNDEDNPDEDFLGGAEDDRPKFQDGVKRSEETEEEREKEMEDDDEHYRYRVKRHADAPEQTGKEFKFKRRKKPIAGEIISQQIEPDDEATAKHAVVVTGVYDAIFNDVMQLIESVQKYLPDTQMAIFEINLSANLREKLDRACNVVVKPFWMDIFPKHVSDYSTHSWRPFVMQLALAEYHFIVWVDPEVKLIHGGIEKALRLATSSGVAAVSSNSVKSPLSHTHPDMFQYIPTEKTLLDSLPHMHISLLVLHNTEELQEQLMRWLLLCSSERECLAPEGSTPDCKSDRVKRGEAHCHSYEVSAINILLNNWFHFDTRRYYVKDAITAPTSNNVKPNNLKICDRKLHKRDL